MDDPAAAQAFGGRGMRQRTMSSTSSLAGDDAGGSTGGLLTNLIVNYLPASLTRDELHTMFSEVGPLRTCRLVYDKISGVSLGYGFIDFLSADDAQEAIRRFHGLQLGSKKLKVALARKSSSAIMRANLYLRSIPLHYTEQDLQRLFEPFGVIIGIHLLRNPDNSSRGVGFVRYDQRAEADAAIAALNERPLDDGTVLLVKYADEGAPTHVLPTTNLPKAALADDTSSVGMGSMRYGSQSSLDSIDRTSMSTQQRWLGEHPEVFKLQVNNLPAEYTEAALARLCTPYGPVLHVQLLRRPGVPGLVQGIVTMASHGSVMVAQAHLHGFLVLGKVLDVRLRTNMVAAAQSRDA